MPRPQLTEAELQSTRDRLARVALEIYCAEGLEAVTFRRLGTALNLSHMHAYRYFDNKEALLARMRAIVLGEFGRYVTQRDTGSAPPMERVQVMVMGYVQYALEHTAEYLLVFSTQQPPVSEYPDVVEARRVVFEEAVDAVKACTEAGLMEGDPREIAHGVWVSMHGLLTLHAANQLVHGMSLDELLQPLLQALLQAWAPEKLVELVD